MIEYYPNDSKRIADRILLDNSDQRHIVDELNQKVTEINALIKEAYSNGDIVQSSNLVSTVDGPELHLVIDAVKNGFWKRG